MRSQQHVTKAKNIHKDSFMIRHMIRDHKQIPIETSKEFMKFTILEYHRKPIERMVAEATEIRRMKKLPKKKLLNSKMEYSRTLIPEITEKPITEREMEEERELDNLIDN